MSAVGGSSDTTSSSCMESISAPGLSSGAASTTTLGASFAACSGTVSAGRSNANTVSSISASATTGSSATGPVAIDSSTTGSVTGASSSATSIAGAGSFAATSGPVMTTSRVPISSADSPAATLTLSLVFALSPPLRSSGLGLTNKLITCLPRAKSAAVYDQTPAACSLNSTICNSS